MIKCFLLSWMIVRFEPIQWLLELLPNKLYKWILITLTSCLKCSNFWISFIFIHDIFIASAMAFIGMLYEKTIGTWETKINFN
jgi:hypothetical protein